jgi:hypothetical protein
MLIYTVKNVGECQQWKEIRGKSQNSNALSARPKE